MRWWTADVARHAIAAAVLLAALLGTAWDVATVPVPAVGPFHGRGFAVLAMLVDTGMLVLVSGRWRWSHVGLAAMFGILAILSLATWSTGAQSCGCFGPVLIPPMVTAGIDAALAVSWIPSSRLHRSRATGLCVGAAGAVLVLTAIWFPRTDPQQAVQEILRSASTTDLIHGRWMVLLYRDDCAHCRASFRAWVMAVAADPRPHDARWCFLALGDVPHDEQLAVQEPPSDAVVLARTRDWPSVETPVAWEVHDGFRVAIYPSPLLDH